MSKPLFDDVTMPNAHGNGDHDNSIRNVEITSPTRDARRARRAERRQSALAEQHVPPQDTGTHIVGTKRDKKNIRLWGIAIFLLALASVGVTFVFVGKTTITVTPVEERVTLAGNVVHTAYAEPEAGELGFNVLSHAITVEKEVPSTGSEYAEEKASGTIVVYNDYSTASQRLIKNTRFETPDGMIYRVRNSFVVPGQHEDAQGNTTPGSIEVTVYADAPGENYNKDTATFTIPGLAGDPRYTHFSAKTVTPLAGGFNGQRPVVDENTIALARAELKATLETELNDYITLRAGDEFVMFDDAVFITYTDIEPTYSGDTAVISERASVQAVTFGMHDVAKAIATATLASIEGGAIRIDKDSLEAATIRLVNKEEIDLGVDALLQFTVDGALNLVWDIDTDALKRDLVGKNSAALQTIMAGYPGIENATATIRPFWKSAFPTDESNIDVEVVRKGE